MTHQPAKLRLKTLPEATLIDSHDNREERKGQQQMHGLEYVDDLVGLASVEVINEEDDAIDRTADFLDLFGFFLCFG